MTERRTAMLGAMLTAIGPISMAIYTPAMPELVEAFGASESAIKMSLSLYFGGFAVAQLISGPLSDAFGRRTATIGFLLIYLAGSLLAAFAPDIEWLLAGRLIQGIGASVGVTVSRAIVRDQFIGPQAARIMNTIGIMLAIGPAAAPTIGGLALAAFGWQSIFFLLIGFGLFAGGVVMFFMLETTRAEPGMARPGRLLAAYIELTCNLRFMAASLVLGGAIGALYAQATMLPFILIENVGLTPTAFGLGMLMQSGAFFSGSVCLKLLARHLSGHGAIHVGLGFVGTGALAIILSVLLLEPGFLSIMIPVALCTFGIAFISPHIITMGLQPFPHMAGSASALMGFVQMSGGFLGGVAAAMIGKPVMAFGIVIPAMEFIAIAAYLLFCRAGKETA